MPRLAANLSTLFAEVPFLDRFERAARAGFSAVEFQFAYEIDVAEIAARLVDNGLSLALFNTPAGDWERGERGLAASPARVDAFRTGLSQALDRAIDLGCPRVHVLAGLTTGDADARAMREVYIDNLRYAAQFAALSGVEILIEPISRQAIPDYFLSGIDMAADIVDEVGEENLFIQYDLFHQRFEGAELADVFETHTQRIRHVQVAGWPHRHEPDEAAPEWRAAFAALDAAGYAGFVGCEYFPAGKTEQGLAWARPWLEVDE